MSSRVLIIGVTCDTTLNKRLYDDRCCIFFTILALCLRVEFYKMSFLNLFSFCLSDMNTRRSTIRRKEGGVDNERTPPRVNQVPIVGLEDVNQTVPPPKT